MNFKRKYNAPEIKLVKLDNDISLQLASETISSNPPTFEGENVSSQTRDKVLSDPYQYEQW